jgi:hypothetical protein
MYIALRNVDPSLSVRIVIIIACKKVWSSVTAPVSYEHLMQLDRARGRWLAGDTSHCDAHRNTDQCDASAYLYFGRALQF